MTEVRVRGLARTFPGRPPVTALRGVDLDVRSGTLTAVLGASGCGKTTLLRVIAGFERPQAGTVALDDEVVSSPEAVVPPERRRVGIVPQEGALFPHLDVGANVAFGLRGRSRDERRRRVGEVLELVGLPGYEARRPHALSGGQQQRVALARALAPDPAVVLLDEPFTALDAGLRGALRTEVAATLAAARTTALLVTHDQAEAFTMADHLAVMREGRIVQAGAPDVLYHRPVDVEAARFLGEAVLLPGRQADGAAHCALGRVPLARRTGDDAGTPPPDGDVLVCLRPEQVRHDPRSEVRGTVDAVRYQGHDVLVDLHVGDQAVRARWPSLELPDVGDEVGLAVAGPAVTYPVA